MRILVTGGAGFIGTNAVARYLKRGDEVVIFDNLSRKGSELNWRWLLKQGDFQFYREDLKLCWDLQKDGFFREPFDVVLHLAAQVAVTDSINDPINDFDINAHETLLLLDSVRRAGWDPVFIFSSTNKVYGSLKKIRLIEEKKRYRFAGSRKGITENQLLDFHSPYGCSKGCADQYVRDYARIYGMRTVVLRQSCIYGPHQFGIEDQGWLAWFIVSHLSNKPITVYGNGKQVRDVLYIEDLLDCFDKVVENIDTVKGGIYNIGGGSENQISILEFFDMLLELTGEKVEYKYSKERQGDQKIYVSDITKAQNELNWKPCIPLKRGLVQLYDWIREELC